MSWKTVRLGDVCEVSRGTTITKKQTEDGNIPVVAGGIKPTYFHNQPNRFNPCITISGSGANAGYVNFWHNPIFASDCSTVECKESEFDIRFIYYFLKSNEDYIYKNLRHGAAQPHVYAKDIKLLKFPLVSLEEQKRIVAKLDAVFGEIDKAIEIETKQLDNYEVLQSKTLEDIFIKYKFEKKELVSLCSNGNKDIVDGPFGSNLKREHFIDSGIPVLKIQNIKPFQIINKNMDYISEEKSKELERHSFKRNDIIITKLGLPLGVSAIVEDYDYGVIVADLVRVRSDKVNNRYLCYYLNSPTASKLLNDAQTGTTRPRIKLSIVRNLPVPFCSLDKQLTIVDKLDNSLFEIKKRISQSKQKLEELHHLRSSILTQELKSEAA